VAQLGTWYILINRGYVCVLQATQKAQLSQRDRAMLREFVSLNISLSHSRSLKII